ncbi:hypothetical protein PtA15_7A49 [Puccinia triticina]|uniref:Uncharacterized protein n=1 Tax=Puccinia triticina TaxID=208348 RepID=A0ABY7CPQ6_9BASI|nr:uncharacterized protein PtA15_7A49 [Puccinia triticina]WAQ86323.1 hypothetical protein PtA15_7A49 [Puccinia triticina]
MPPENQQLLMPDADQDFDLDSKCGNADDEDDEPRALETESDANSDNEITQDTAASTRPHPSKHQKSLKLQELCKRVCSLSVHTVTSWISRTYSIT